MPVTFDQIGLMIGSAVVSWFARGIYEKRAFRGKASILIVPREEWAADEKTGVRHLQTAWEVTNCNPGGVEPVYFSGFRVRLDQKDADGFRFREWLFEEQFKLEPHQERGPIEMGLFNPSTIAQANKGWVLSGGKHKW